MGRQSFCVPSRRCCMRAYIVNYYCRVSFGPRVPPFACTVSPCVEWMAREPTRGGTPRVKVSFSGVLWGEFRSSYLSGGFARYRPPRDCWAASLRGSQPPRNLVRIAYSVRFVNVFWSNRVDLGPRVLFASRVAYCIGLLYVRCECAAREAVPWRHLLSCPFRLCGWACE